MSNKREVQGAGHPLFSIIVPVYQSQETLNECIDSVLCQQCQNYEMILIDDGSTDMSRKICDEYAERYPRNISVIHKSNKGPLMARIEGIQMSQGEYLLFLDADDSYVPGIFYKLENIIKQNIIPQVWQESYWLAGELFLPLDEDLTVTFEGLRMRYDREYGMRVCDDRDRIQPDPREVDTGDERGWDDRGSGSGGCAGPCSRISPHIERTPYLGLCPDEASDGNGLRLQSRMAGRDR